MPNLPIYQHVNGWLEKKSNNNATVATLRLLKELKVPATTSNVIDFIESHPNFPSILSISDTLNQWKVENVALRIEADKLDTLPTPFVSHTKVMGGNFILVQSVNGKVDYINERGKRNSIVKDEFVKDWSGVVLLASANSTSGQSNYALSRRKEIVEQLRIPAVILTSLLLVVLYGLTQEGNSNWWNPLLLLVKLAGSLAAGLLLWFEIDKSNPALQQICSAGRKTNCSAVLGSKGARLFGLLSWSEIGFFYFVGGCLFLLTTLNSAYPFLAVLAGMNLLALPFIAYSLVYQWRMARQWCPLCLTIQALLLFEFVVAYFGFWRQLPLELPPFAGSQLVILLTAYLLPVMFWIATKKTYLAAQRGGEYKKALAQLKYNKDIFSALLEKQKPVVANTQGLGITIGNPHAKNTIIKVCNPYCGPCAKAHAVIDELLATNPDVKVQIIFNVSADENDYRSLPAKHLMAIYEKGNDHLIRNALDDWYMPAKKDHTAFAEKYASYTELELQKRNIEAMDAWCRETGISFTPTFFINGYQLPDQYSVTDIKFLLP